MKSHKIVFSLFILLVIACKKSGPIQTQLYTEDGMEVLNGRVKEIYEGDSSKRLSAYFKYNFNKDGDMISSVSRKIGISSTERQTDTDIYIDKRQYTVNRNDKGLITTIKYNASDSNLKDSIHHYSNLYKFDKEGHLFTCGDPGDSTAHITYYECNAAGYALKSTLIFGQTLTEPVVRKYIYDSKHMLIEQTLYERALLNKVIFEYKEFDFYHNWIRRVNRLHNYLLGGDHDPPTFNVTRKITYY